MRCQSNQIIGYMLVLSVIRSASFTAAAAYCYRYCSCFYCCCCCRYRCCLQCIGILPHILICLWLLAALLLLLLSFISNRIDWMSANQRIFINLKQFHTAFEFDWRPKYKNTVEFELTKRCPAKIQKCRIHSHSVSIRAVL